MSSATSVKCMAWAIARPRPKAARDVAKMRTILERRLSEDVGGADNIV